MKTLCLFLIVLPISCWSYTLEKQIKVETVGVKVNPVNDASITKRSGGSFDFVQHIKTGLLAGAGRASSSLVAGSSGHSSGGQSKQWNSGGHSEETHENSVEEHDHWSLKSSVLNTIFQALKAITGGVTTLKGQLIRGSGYALSAGGSLIVSSGDKITDVGKGIVKSAQLVPVSSSSSISGGSSHPFAKFASLSSSPSSGSSGGGHGHSHSHGGSDHGETPQYDVPTPHQIYGPPLKHEYEESPQYLPPGTYTSGVHYTGPASFESLPHSHPGEGSYY